MKTLIIAALLVISQFTFAATPVRLSHDAAQKAVSESAGYKQVAAHIEGGKSITESPRLVKYLLKAVGLHLNDMKKLDGTDFNFNEAKLMNLINIDAHGTLTKIVELTSIIKDPAVNATEKKQAKLALELLELSGAGVRSTAVNKAQADANKVELVKNVEAIQVVSKLSTIEHKNVESLVNEFRTLMQGGTPASKAYIIAGQKKGKDGKDLTEEQMKSCIL